MDSPLALTPEVKQQIVTEAQAELQRRRRMEASKSSLHSGVVTKRNRNDHVVVRDHHQRRLSELKEFAYSQFNPNQLTKFNPGEFPL